MADIEAIKAKIRALQSRTTARGCTEAEAMAATEVALRLMQEHGLSDDQVAISERRVDLKRRGRSDIDGIWPMVARTARCACYYSIGQTRSIAYLGRDPWPEVAAYLHDVIAGAVRAATREFHRSDDYRRRRSPRTRALAQRHFLRGLAEGLAFKLWALTRESQGDDAVKRDLAAAVAALDAMQDMRTARYKPPPNGHRYAGPQMAGRDAGRNANVSWGVNGAQPVHAIGGPEAG